MFSPVFVFAFVVVMSPSGSQAIMANGNCTEADMERLDPRVMTCSKNKAEAMVRNLQRI